MRNTFTALLILCLTILFGPISFAQVSPSEGTKENTQQSTDSNDPYGIGGLFSAIFEAALEDTLGKLMTDGLIDPVPFSESQKEVGEKIKELEILIDSGQSRQAHRKLGEIEDLYTNENSSFYHDIKLQILKAQSISALGDIEGAIRIYQALEANFDLKLGLATGFQTEWSTEKKRFFVSIHYARSIWINELGRLQALSGRMKIAETTYKEAINYYSDKEIQERLKFGLAKNVFEKSGRVQEAISIYKEIDTSLDLKLFSFVDLGFVKSFFSWNYNSQDLEYFDFLPLYMVALEIRRLDALSSALLLENNREEALTVRAKKKRIVAQVLNIDPRSSIAIKSHFEDYEFSLNLGENDLALSSLNRVRKLVENDTSLSKFQHKLTLANNYQSLAEYEHAQSILLELASIASSEFGEDSPTYTKVNYLIAKNIKENEPNNSLHAFNYSKLATRSHRNGTAIKYDLSPISHLNLEYDVSHQDIFELDADLASSIFLENHDKAIGDHAFVSSQLYHSNEIEWNQINTATSSLFSGTTGVNNIKGNPLKELQELGWEQQKLQYELTSELKYEKPNVELLETITNKLSSVRYEIIKLRDTISSWDSQFADLVNIRALTISDIQDNLGDNEAFVFLSSTENFITIFAIDAGAFSVTKLDFAEDVLISKVKNLHQKMRSNLEDPRQEALELYTLLFSNSSSILANKKDIVLVPTGPLGAIPFNALITAAPETMSFDANSFNNTKWFGLDKNLSVLPSVGSFKWVRKKIDNPINYTKLMMGFADPYLPSDSKIKSVKHTRQEVQKIVNLLGEKESDEFIFFGKRASETNLKSADLTTSQILMFATHGYLGGDIVNLPNNQQLLDEPALLMSHVNNPNEYDDAILTASEIANLSIKSDWVILSACDTGRGLNKELSAFDGLIKAFFIAGTNSLLVSNWAVGDDAAANLTSGMFAEISENSDLSKTEALSQAMKRIMKNDSHPYNWHPSRWASFTVVGNYDPMVLKKKTIFEMLASLNSRIGYAALLFFGIVVLLLLNGHNSIWLLILKAKKYFLTSRHCAPNKWIMRVLITLSVLYSIFSVLQLFLVAAFDTFGGGEVVIDTELFFFIGAIFISFSTFFLIKGRPQSELFLLIGTLSNLIGSGVTAGEYEEIVSILPPLILVFLIVVFAASVSWICRFEEKSAISPRYQYFSHLLLLLFLVGAVFLPVTEWKKRNDMSLCPYSKRLEYNRKLDLSEFFTNRELPSLELSIDEWLRVNDRKSDVTSHPSGIQYGVDIEGVKFNDPLDSKTSVEVEIWQYDPASNIVRGPATEYISGQDSDIIFSPILEGMKICEVRTIFVPRHLYFDNSDTSEILYGTRSRRELPDKISMYIFQVVRKY